MKQNQEISAAMELLVAQAQEWGLSLSSKQLALLRRYAELLATYTEANVIGTKEIRNIILDHVLDSLSCLLLEGEEVAGPVIDVGAGGGLPGIPFAIARPDTAVTLLEATEKKARFLRSAQEQLGLKSVEVLSQRAEEAGRQVGFRDVYGIAVSRALASLPVVVEYCAPFVREGGIVLAMKGRLEDEELTSGKRAASRLGAEFSEVIHVPIVRELEQKQRRIVVLRKTAPTPTGYPRRIGLAKKQPLGT